MTNNIGQQAWVVQHVMIEEAKHTEAASTAMSEEFSWIWLMTCRQTFVCAPYTGRRRA